MWSTASEPGISSTIIGQCSLMSVKLLTHSGSTYCNRTQVRLSSVCLISSNSYCGRDKLNLVLWSTRHRSTVPETKKGGNHKKVYETIIASQPGATKEYKEAWNKKYWSWEIHTCAFASPSRQTDRETDRQTGALADELTLTGGLTDRRTDRQSGALADGLIVWLTDGLTNRQTSRLTDR